MATFGQLYDALAVLANKVTGAKTWNQIDSNVVQAALADRERFATEFIRFVANGGRCIVNAVPAIWQVLKIGHYTNEQLTEKLRNANVQVDPRSKVGTAPEGRSTFGN